ncbi:MAG: aminoglycoside phosphotransferase family protein [Bdellovibrionales bacterium]
MDERERLIDDFIIANGWGDARRIDMGGDASIRSYIRLVKPDGTKAIVMNAPLDEEEIVCTPEMSEAERIAAGYCAHRRTAASRVDAFVCIGEFLHQAGFTVPEIHAFNVTDGLALLGDLGEGQYWSLLQQANKDEEAMYEAATDVLVKLAGVKVPQVLEYNGASWPMLSYDAVAMDCEADMFIDWFAEHHCGLTVDDAVRGAYRAAWHQMYKHLETDSPVLIIRDYHSPNIMWLPEKQGQARAGVIDFQDAVTGHAAFDVQFLFNDARRDVNPAIAKKMLQRYLAATQVDETSFMNAYHVFKALNNARICGIFCRLNYRDGKAGYIKHLPRVQNFVLDSLKHPACAPLADWFKTYLPDVLKEAA